MTVTWRDALAGELRDLGPRFDGRVVRPRPEDEVVPVARYFDHAHLREAILRIATTPLHTVPGSEPDEDVKLSIAASRFTRHYLGALTLAALVGLANGVGLDLAATRCSRVVWANMPYRLVVDLDQHEVVGCAERPTSWPRPGRMVETVDELRQFVWQKLYGEHVAPLFDRVGEIARTSANVLWCNAAEWASFVGLSTDGAVLSTELEAYAAEGNAVLGAERLPGVDGRNPMRDRVEWIPVDVPDFPLGVPTRRQCCMTYLLAERAGFLCSNCPFLPLDDRVALAREQRTEQTGDGLELPAARRSIAHGRRKLRAGPSNVVA